MRRSVQNRKLRDSPSGWQENTIGTHGRFAVGLCAVSIALLYGGFGGTIAAAETEPGGQVSESQAPDAQGPDTTPNETVPVASPQPPAIPDTLPELLAAMAQAPTTETQPEESHESHGEPASLPDLTGPMALGVSTTDGPGENAVAESNNSVVTPADAHDSDTAIEVAAAAATEEPTAPEAVVSHSPAAEPSTQQEEVAADSPTPPPSETPPAPEPAAVGLVTNEGAPVEDSTASVVGDAAQAAAVTAAPPSDILKALAYIFIALTDHDATVIHLPGSLLSLLGIPLMGDGATVVIAPAGGIGGSLLASGPYSAPQSSVLPTLTAAPGWPEMLMAQGDSRVLSALGAVTHSFIGGVAASGMAEKPPIDVRVLLPDDVVPEQLRSVLEHTVGAVLAPLSVLALAALASPGVTGLVLLGLAGMFVGYRQAKAASMLRASGIARFVKSGPLGVVRSGALVAVHSRGSHAQHRPTSRPREVLETVA